jgi:CDP-paratose 2-epimerase
MDICLITGSTGLIGSESVEFFADKFDMIVGIDNNMRERFFGQDGSTIWNRVRLEKMFSNYRHYSIDIRDKLEIEKLFEKYNSDIKLIIHSAAQPSHDWAANEPHTDFDVNANGTINLLENTRRYASDAVFIFTSTNKVYGDMPNRLPLVELETRWEVDMNHKYFVNGIDESMSIDQSMHSLFGVSKLAADVLVQEYGKYFNMKTVCFRGGCLTGPNHAGTKLHGFLSFLMKCAITKESYTIFGYKGKQVRDNMHSYDLVNMFWHFYNDPRRGEVYNVGGGRYRSCSVLEAIRLCENITSEKVSYSYIPRERKGDHIWWISDVSKFRSHYPNWDFKYDLEGILVEIYEAILKRL